MTTKHRLKYLFLIGKIKEMGKSFKSDKNQYSESKNRVNDYKRKKSKIKEENFHDEFSEYKIHGFKNKYQKND